MSSSGRRFVRTEGDADANHARGMCGAGRNPRTKLNAATGPAAVALPLGGVSVLDVEGTDFYDPEADAALFDAIHALDPAVELFEMEAAINDEAFARALAEKLDEYMRAAGVGP